MKRLLVAITAVLLALPSMAQLYAYAINGKAQIRRDGVIRNVFVADILMEDDTLTTEEYGYIVVLDRYRNKQYSFQSPAPQSLRALIASQGAYAHTLPREYIQHLYLLLMGYAADSVVNDDGVTYRSENIDLVIAQTLAQTSVSQTVDFRFLDQQTLQPVSYVEEGQTVVLQIENRSDSSLYTNIIDRDPAGETVILLPVNPFDSLSEVFVPPHSQIRLNTNPISFSPAGTTDELILIAHSEPFNASRVIRHLPPGIHTKKIDIQAAIPYSLASQGLAYSEIGDYSNAEESLLQSADRYRDLLGENHPNYASALNNLGNFYRNIGDYAKAESYYRQSLSILKTISGVNHPDYAAALNNLGNLCRNTRKYAQAEQYYLQALAVLQSVFGVNHPDYASALNNLGLLYCDIGDYTQARQYYLRAADSYKSGLGEDHPKYAILLDNMGNLYRTIGDFALAEQYYLQSLAILKTTFGENHPDYAAALHDLGSLYYNFRDYPKAEPCLLQSQEISKSCFLKSLDYMSEQQREAYWNTIKKRYESTYPSYSWRFAVRNPSVSTFAYNNELFTKGLLLNSSSAIRLSIAESGDTTLIRLWDDLTTIKQKIIALEDNSPHSPDLSVLTDQAEILEKELTRSSATYRENMRQWSITWDSVKAVLTPNQVAIEYMRVPLSEDSIMYCALLLRDTCSYPIMIPLFEEKEVSQVLDISNPTSVNKAYSYHKNGLELSRLIWSKVLPYIHPGEIVFFAPTGLLHEVAMESIPYDSTQVISDVYNLVRLSSTRELAIHKPAVPHKTATLYGGISYDVSADELLAQSTAYPSLASRSVINDTINRGRVQYLPGTKSEIEGIQKTLSCKKIRVQAYTASAANEESFKALSGTGQNILHIATHGFYWADSTHIDPMERSGLLLAGANITLSGHSERLPDGVEDGILTAKEISVLNLREADIVVLSACETAQGEITGEGVFGLQRAFKMAGAQTLLMAIWPVSDEATRLLMTAFYRYMNRGMSKRQAFRAAQQEVRNYTAGEGSSEDDRALSGKEKMMNKGKMGGSQQAPRPPKGGAASSEGADLHPYASPYYWAGFILLD